MSELGEAEPLDEDNIYSEAQGKRPNPGIQLVSATDERVNDQVLELREAEPLDEYNIDFETQGEKPNP